MMNSLSLFDTAGELSLQMETYLDSPFGFPDDTLHAEDGLGGLFGVKTEDPFGDLKPSDSFPQPQNELDDLLLEGVGGPLSDDWMEIVDLNFLNDNVPAVETIPQVQSMPKDPLKPLVIKQKTQGVQVEIEQPEQIKKGQSIAQESGAFDLLKSLLTGAVQLHQSPLVTVQPTPPESPEPQVAPQIASPLSSVSSPLGSYVSDSFDMPVSEEIPIPNPAFEVVEVEPEIQLQPVVEFDSIETESFDLGSPLNSSLSADDIESILQSGPSSPDEYLKTIDQSQLDGFDVTLTGENGKPRKDFKQSKQSFSIEQKHCRVIKTVKLEDFDESSQDSSSEDPTYTPPSKASKSRTVRKSRATPYVIEEYLPPCESLNLSRKEKKRMQNKNAATRYRQKKREQKNTIQQEEEVLQKKNDDLRDKVDTLEREIKYMKDLMQEIYKVKELQTVN